MIPPKPGYWLILALALGVYATMILWTLPDITTEADGLVPFDLRPTGYGADEARNFLNALSNEGRETYLGPQRLLDVLYPVLLALVLAGAARALVRRGAARLLLLLVILGGMLADYTENTLVAGLLTTDPVTDAAIAAASRATIVKSALTGLAMGWILLALARWLTQNWRR